MRSLSLAKSGPQGLRRGHITLLELKRKVRIKYEVEAIKYFNNNELKDRSPWNYNN